MKTQTGLKVANRLYGLSTYLALYVIAGLVGLLPTWLQIPVTWGGGAALLLASIAYLVERKAANSIRIHAAETKQVAPARPVPRPAVSPVDRQIEEGIRFVERAHSELEEEEQDFPTMADLPQEESFSEGGSTVEITFEDLGRLPTILLDAIESHMDSVPPIDQDRIVRKTRQDTYHVRADGKRYDLRTLRSVP